MKTNTQVKPLINGCCKSTTGHRMVIVSASGELRPVVYAVHSGYETERGTFQSPVTAGDLMFKCEWGRNGTHYPVLNWNGVEWIALPYAKFSSLWRMLTIKQQWADEFLKEQGRTCSFIPQEAYGETLSDKSKRHRLERFTDTYGVDLNEYYSKIQITPKNMVNLKPALMSRADAEKIIPQWHTHIGSVVGINQKDLFWAYDGKNPAVIIPCVYEGKHGSNYAHDKTEYMTGAPLQIPAGTKVLIKLQLGCCVKDHYSYGCSIDVYNLT